MRSPRDALARAQARLRPERNEALARAGRDVVLHDREVARPDRRAIGAHDHEERTVRVAVEFVGVILCAMHSVPGTKRSETCGVDAQRREARAQPQVRLRDPRVAAAGKAPGLALDRAFVEALEVGPVARAMPQHEGDRKVAVHGRSVREQAFDRVHSRYSCAHCCKQILRFAGEDEKKGRGRGLFLVLAKH